MLNISKYVCKKSGGLTTNFVDSRIFKLKNWILCSLALEHCIIMGPIILVGKYGSTSYIGMTRKKNGGQ